MDKFKITVPSEGVIFRGVNSKYAPGMAAVAPTQFTAGTRNTMTDDGVIERCLGDLDYSATNDMLGSAESMYACSLDDGKHLLAHCSGIIYDTTGDGALTAAASGLTEQGHLEYLAYDNKVYLCNGIDENQVLDSASTYGGVDYGDGIHMREMGCPSPAVSPSGVLATGGSVPVGGHRYAVTFVYNSLEESDLGTATSLLTATSDVRCIITSVDSPVQLTVSSTLGMTAGQVFKQEGLATTTITTVTDDTTLQVASTTGFSDSGATATASGGFAFGTPVNDDTIIVSNLPNDGTMTFTKVTTPVAGAPQFSTAANLASIMNSLLSDVTATNTSGILSFVADISGEVMNSATITGTGVYSSLDITFSGGSGVQALAEGLRTINLSGIPIGGYAVTARKVYRDNGDGAYGLVTTLLDNTTTTYTDDDAAYGDEPPSGNDTPPKFTQMEFWRESVWGANGGFTVYKMLANQPNVWNGDTVTTDTRTSIVGLKLYDDKLYVMGADSIGYIIYSNGLYQFNILTDTVGCVDNRLTQIITNKGVPLLVWASPKGFYTTNGSSVDCISEEIEDLVNYNIQQIKVDRDRDQQTTQADFEGGTKTDGLTILGGSVTTAVPTKLWEGETDWEGGETFTSIATNDGTNNLKAAIRKAWAYSSGTVQGAATVSGADLKLDVVSDFTGESHATGAGSSFSYLSATGLATSTFEHAFPVKTEKSGTLTGITSAIQCNTSTNPLSATVKLYDALLSELATQTVSVSMSGGLGTVSASFSQEIVGNTTYWVGIRVSGATGGSFPSIRSVGSTDAWNGGTTGITRQLSPNALGWFNETSSFAIPGTFSFTQNATASSGSWTSPVYDSYLHTGTWAGTNTLSLTATYPSGTASTAYLDQSDSVGMSTYSTQSVASLNGSQAFTWTPIKRFFRLRASLTTDDDRITPTLGAPTLTFPTNGVWVSSAVDLGADVSALNGLVVSSYVPSGTSITAEVATSSDNVTYSAYSAIGAATPARYLKVRVTLTTASSNSATPYVSSIRLNWTAQGTFISRVIDTGVAPTGIDPFSESSTGDVVFSMRSSDTSGGLTAESWTTVEQGNIPEVAFRRFLQWRAILTATGSTASVLEEVTVGWVRSSTNTTLRGASLFHDLNYYASVAEMGSSTNNLVINRDRNGSWHILEKPINSFALFNQVPYVASSESNAIRLFNNTESVDQLTLDVRTPAYDSGNPKQMNILKGITLTGTGTGEVVELTAEYSTDQGVSYRPLKDHRGLPVALLPAEGPWQHELVPGISADANGKSFMFRFIVNGEQLASPAKVRIESLEVRGFKRGIGMRGF